MDDIHDIPPSEDATGAGKKPQRGFVLVDGDVEIFRLLYEYRLLRREHIAALTLRPYKRLHRRLLKLVQQGFLATIRLPQQKHIYSLGKRAVSVLVEHGAADDDLLLQRIRTHELKEFFLKHEMMIVDIHVMLALATRGSVLALTAWREGRELYDSVQVAFHRGIEKLPIRPDAFWSLEDARRPTGRNTTHLFLEADRSTATQTRFQDKLRAYWHYLEQGMHVTKFGIKSFRVLTVTLTEERARNLCALACALLPEAARKYFLFTSIVHFSLDNPAPILGSVYRSPRDLTEDTRYPLVPAPAPSDSIVT